MNKSTFKKIYLLVILFILASIITAVVTNNLIMSLVGLLIGILFVIFIGLKIKTPLNDERTESINSKTSYLAFHIITLFLGLLSMFLIISGYINQDYATESLGVTLGYVTLLNLMIYAIIYRYYNKLYSSNDQ